MSLETRLAELRRSLDEAAARRSFWGRLDARLLELKEDRCVLAIQPNAERLNLAGWLHGGEAAAIIDQAAGIAANACPEGRWVTAETRIRYRAPLPGDRPLTCSADVQHREHRRAHVAATLRPEGEADAAVTAELVFLRPKNAPR